MAVTASTNWEVRTTGSDLNGGGFDPTVAGAGIDRSQQDAAHFTGSAASTTSVSTTVGLGAAVADNSWVGNVIRLSGGSGAQTPVHKVIVSVTDASTVAVNSATGLVTGTGVSIAMGGAAAGIVYLCHGSGAHAQSGNAVYVRGGTGPQVYPIAIPINCLRGTSGNPFMVVGYDPAHVAETRTRLFIRRTAVRPVLRGATGASGNLWTLGGNAQRLKGLDLDSNGFFVTGVVETLIIDCILRGFSHVGAMGNAYLCQAIGGERGFANWSAFYCYAQGATTAGFNPGGLGVSLGCVAKACAAGFTTSSLSHARTAAINCLADGSAIATPNTPGGTGFTTDLNVNCVARRCVTGFGGGNATAVDLACAAWGCTTTAGAGRSSTMRGGALGIIELTADPVEDAGALNFSMSAAVRTALEDTGFPVDLLGTIGESFSDIGPFSPIAAVGGGPGVLIRRGFDAGFNQ